MVLRMWKCTFLILQHVLVTRRMLWALAFILVISTQDAALMVVGMASCNFQQLPVTTEFIITLPIFSLLFVGCRHL